MEWILIVTLWTSSPAIHSIDGFKTEKACEDAAFAYFITTSLRKKMIEGKSVDVEDSRGELVKTVCVSTKES